MTLHFESLETVRRPSSCVVVRLFQSQCENLLLLKIRIAVEQSRRNGADVTPRCQSAHMRDLNTEI